MSVPWWWYPSRNFKIDGLNFAVRTTARTNGLQTELRMLDVPVATDLTPLSGPEAVRNHELVSDLPDGRRLSVEAGYIGVWSIGIVARLDGQVVHESHPGRAPQFPEKYKAHTATDWKTVGIMAPRNRLPFAIDVATGILFFVVAKLTDLTTAALVGAAVGVALVVFQRITRIDVTGGLALFGIVMLCISAGLALAFADEEWIKQRSTIVGLIAASLFLTDGLLGGKRLASALARYMPYDDIDPARLGIGIGLAGVVMAALNFVVARTFPTDIWLFYTTFVDVFVYMGLFFGVLGYARPRRT